MVKTGPHPFGTPDYGGEREPPPAGSRALQVLAASGIVVVAATIFVSAGAGGAFNDPSTAHGAALSTAWATFEHTGIYWATLLQDAWHRSVWLWAGWGLISVFLFVTLRWMTRLGN